MDLRSNSRVRHSNPRAADSSTIFERRGEIAEDLRHIPGGDDPEGRAMTKLESGIDLLAEESGEGPAAARGDVVVYNWRIHLNRGDEVLLNERQIPDVPPDRRRSEAGRSFVDHRTRLGSRQVIAGVEKSLLGMRAGGYRKVRVGPHLAYRERGVPDLIPENAVLVFELWLRAIEPPDSTP
jgi:hypothetical protein